MYFEFSFDILLICDLFLATLGENILSLTSTRRIQVLYVYIIYVSLQGG